MNLNVKDKVSFDGDIDMPALAETTVAFVDAAKHQIIIEHPNGHLGQEFTNTPGLSSTGKYTYVKAGSVTIIGKAQTFEDVAEVTTKESGEQEAAIPLSVALTMVKDARPASENAIFDKFIAEATKIEQKTAAATKVDITKSIEKENAKSQAAEAGVESKANDVLDEETIKRLQDQEDTRKEIMKMVNYLVGKGVLVFDKSRNIWIFDGVTIPLFVGNGITPELAISSFYQNAEDEFENLKANVLKHVEIDKAGPTAAATEAEAALNNTSASTKDFKAKALAANAKAREAKNAAKLKGDDGASAATEPTITDAEAASTTIADTNVSTEKINKNEANLEAEKYAADLLALDGIGPKVVAKIIDAYPTKAALAAGVASKSLPFTDKQNEMLKKAMKRKAFKVA